MNKNFSLQRIPNTLDVNELMEVKGGFNIGPICIPSGSVKCEKGANAVINVKDPRLLQYAKAKPLQ